MAATLIDGAKIYAPYFKITLNGEPYPPRESILNVEIDEDLETPALLKISLNESLDIKTQLFTFLDDEMLKPGSEVVVNLGYAASEKPVLFRGRIKSISPSFLSTGNISLSIEGYDLSFDLKKKQTEFKDTQVTYSMVAEEIARKNGLIPKGVEATKITHAKVEREKNEKDYETLKRLSSDVGYEFFVRDNVLYFREPKDNLEGKITFEFRKNFINFSPRMATATLVNEVNVTAWDGKKKEGISETASIKEIKNTVGFPNFDSLVEQSQGSALKIKMEGRAVRSREEAKTLAIAELKRRNKGFIEGSLECVGDPELRPGMTVNITKVGERFSGMYYVTKAKHSIGDGGYKTTLDVRRSVL
jgi:phage protein D